MDESMIRGRALAHARLALEEFEFLSVVEMLDDDGIEYTDDEAEQIYALITNAQVALRD